MNNNLRIRVLVAFFVRLSEQLLVDDLIRHKLLQATAELAARIALQRDEIGSERS